MKIIVLLVSFASFVACGVIPDGHHQQATSYQSIHMEHYKAVPTYVKKEDQHYIDHPISEGNTETKVEVHHGSKHEPGYAVAATHSEIHGHHCQHKFVAAGGHSGHGYEHDDGHQQVEHHEEQHADIKHFEPAQYNGGYSEEAGQDEGHVEHEEHEGHNQEEPRGHYQYNHNQEEAHDGDENASYYHHEGQQEGDEGGHASYEQAGHEESAEHY